MNVMIEVAYTAHPNNNENGVHILGYLDNELAGTVVGNVLGTILEIESIHTNPINRGNGVATCQVPFSLDDLSFT
jgi:hypothetical protein